MMRIKKGKVPLSKSKVRIKESDQIDLQYLRFQGAGPLKGDEEDASSGVKNALSYWRLTG